jgi:hypothetical protein
MPDLHPPKVKRRERLCVILTVTVYSGRVGVTEELVGHEVVYWWCEAGKLCVLCTVWMN